MTRTTTIKKTITDVTDFFCSDKFNYLSVDLEKKIVRSCCSAQTQTIDLKWLKNNPGQLFNTPLFVQEREMMIDGQPVPSCHDTCWSYESKNIKSRRQILQLDQYQNLPTTAEPNKLHITVGNTCNLTCVYCCKEYSDSWYRDIDTNGPYFDHPKFVINSKDKVLANLSQYNKLDNAAYKLLLDEIRKFDNLRLIEIGGGEPFLYNGLSNILDQFDPRVPIELFTGLGVNPTRFSNQLDKIDPKRNIRLSISAESVGELYEFVRYGNSWSQFMKNFNTVIDKGFSVVFRSTITNLTALGLDQFQKTFGQHEILYHFCNEPDWLFVNVLDKHTKEHLTNQLQQSTIHVKDKVLAAISSESSEIQHKNFSIYLKEFAKRRDLPMTIFPPSLIDWINDVV